MKFLFWGAIVCSLLGLLLSAASLILRQAFAAASIITTVSSTIQVAVNAAVLTGTIMIRRSDDGF